MPVIRLRPSLHALRLRPRTSAYLLLGGIIFFASQVHAKDEKAPDWAMQAAQISVPAYGSDVNGCVLLRQDAITVDAAGQAMLYHREVRKILRPQGKPLAEVNVSFDNASKVNFLHVWTIEPDGHVYAVKKKDIVQMAADLEDPSVLFGDAHVEGATAVGVDAGSVVAFEYEQRLEPYLTTEVFDLQQDNLPALQQTVTLQIPEGVPYSTAWKRNAAIAPEKTGADGWQWRIPALPAVEREPMEPARETLHAEMLISYAKGGQPPQAGAWQNIGQWYEQISAGRDDPTPEIAAKAQALTAGTTDFMGKLLAITGYMQDQIRYVAIELGVGGWQPHPAATVFQGHYGDCKDMATLLIALLRAAGISAHYLIVDSHRGFVTPDFPSQFADHMITAIDLPPGLHDSRLQSVVTGQHGQRYLIFDPTNPESPAGQLENELQGGYGLLIDGANTELLHLPVATPAQNGIRRSGHFQMTADGALSGTLETTFTGPDAEHARWLFHSGDRQIEHKALEQNLQDEQAGFTLQKFQTKNEADRNQDFVLDEQLTAAQYVRQAGTMWLVCPHVASSDAEPTATDKPRLYPVQFRATDARVEDYTIDLPVGFTVVDLPDPVELDNGFAVYSSKTVVTGNQIHYTSSLQVRQLEVPADQYGKFVQFMQQVGNAESSQVLLKKTN
jgi:hypothetical protein